MQGLVSVAGILGGSLILAVLVYTAGQLRVEQQRTLQKLIDRGLAGEELRRAAGLEERSSLDLRRGLLLMSIGASWSAVTYFIGGKAWIMGFFPMAIGLAFVIFRALDGRSR